MPEADLALLINAAREAGRIARSFTDARSWDKEDGAGPVTEADLAVDTYLRETLIKARPDYGWLSEETEDDLERLTRRKVFIVDPIDGTRDYIEGGKSWSHSLAVVEDGRVQAGVVFQPMRDRLFCAAKGQGAFLNDAPLSKSEPPDLAQSEILTTRRMLEGRFWRGGQAPSFQRTHRPSLAYRLALVGQGRFDGMITFRPAWEWDIAAGSLIATEAGARVSDRCGTDLLFNQRDPRANGVIAASPAIHAELIDAHDPAG